MKSYIKVIVRLESTETKQVIIDEIKKMHYNEYKLLSIEEKVAYINSLLAEDIPLNEIASRYFNVDESTIRKGLNNSGYKRAWQFIKE